MDLADQVFYAVLVILSGVFVLAAMKLKQPKLAETGIIKGVRKQNEEAVMSHYKTLLEINEDQKVTIASLRGKNKRQSQLLDQDEEAEIDPQELIKQSMPMIQSAAKQFGIDSNKLQALLNTPQAQKWISNPKNLKKLAGYAPLLEAFKNKQGTDELPSIPETQA